MKGMMQAVLVVSAVAMLAGCAGQPKYNFNKSGGNQQEFVQDRAGCDVQSQGIQIADWEYRGTIMEGANIKQKQSGAFLNCMVSKGYTYTTTTQ